MMFFCGITRPKKTKQQQTNSGTRTKGQNKMKTNNANRTEKSFFEAMESLGEGDDSPMALITFLWETWTAGRANSEERYTTQDEEARDFFVRYMKERGMKITKSAPLTLMFSAFVAGMDLALETFMPTDNEGNNDGRKQ